MTKESRSVSPVCSHNEWDPLEEVIVGLLDGAAVPPNHSIERSRGLTGVAAASFALLSGRRYPRLLRTRAQRELDAFVDLLNSEGITVRRPEPMDFTRSYETPHWRSSGFCTASPRDMLMVLGDEIIEAPSAWRARYFEIYAYRKLLREYFHAGARWTAAPKPTLDDDSFDPHFRVPPPGAPMRYAITEVEPLFDAADFTRCGKDVFVTLGNSTNRAGVEWMRRHVGDRYRIHEVETLCREPMHIDTTLIPLAPGKIMINPEYIDPERLPAALADWEVLVPPGPDPVPGMTSSYLSLVSKWIHLNVLSLDERRVVVEASQVSMQAALRRWGFEPVPCPFAHYRMFGGGFHCATVDVRRRGELLSYC